MKNRGIVRQKRGFSLVEVMIAMTLFAIIFTGAFAALQMGYGMTGEARDRTRAGQILATELEAMRTYNWIDLSAMNGESDEIFIPRGEFVEAYADKFTCYRTVTMRTNAEQIDIMLRVEWDVYPNRKSETFQTVFTKDGLNDYYYRAL